IMQLRLGLIIKYCGFLRQHHKNIMHVKSLYLLFLLFPFYSFAQNGSLKVTVKDANSNEPIVGASVSLLTPTAGAYLRGGQTQADGKALIEEIPPGKYTLKISYIGMA